MPGKVTAANLEIHYQKAVIFRRPQALSILVQGKDRLIGNRLEFNQSSRRCPASALWIS